MSLERRLSDAEHRAERITSQANPPAEPFPEDDAEAVALLDRLTARLAELSPPADTTSNGMLRWILKDKDATDAANALARRLAKLRDAERSEKYSHYV